MRERGNERKHTISCLDKTLSIAEAWHTLFRLTDNSQHCACTTQSSFCLHAVLFSGANTVSPLHLAVWEATEGGQALSSKCTLSVTQLGRLIPVDINPAPLLNLMSFLLGNCDRFLMILNQLLYQHREREKNLKIKLDYIYSTSFWGTGALCWPEINPSHQLTHSMCAYTVVLPVGGHLFLHVS